MTKSEHNRQVLYVERFSYSSQPAPTRVDLRFIRPVTKCLSQCHKKDISMQSERGFRNRMRSSATLEELRVELRLLYIERTRLRWLRHLYQMPLDASLKRCFRYIPLEGDPREDPRQVGVTKSLSWPRNTLESSLRS